MLALLSTLTFATAAIFAIGVGYVTMRGRRSQIVSLLADYRSLRGDREFLVHVTSHEPIAPRAFAAPQLRRTARRILNRELVRADRSQRAVA